ncbi:MAG TPA: two pore domain potassium channel family protein [Allosphingosinicella sp.]|nr:two pore domain potassium channel family protein [Allosphingosinicella sp.]
MHPLLTQLVSAAGLVLVMTLVHGAGVVGIAHWLGLDRARSESGRLHPRTMALLSAMTLLLFCLHMIEIGLFGLFYLWVGAVADLEEALYYSASAYSTLAQPDSTFPVAWRIVGALEGLVGFLLIGWSTAFFVTDMNKLLRA